MLRTAPLVLLAVLLAALLPAADASAADCAPAGAVRTSAVVRAQSATLLLMPGPVRTPEPVMTAQIAQLPGFGVALFSPTLGRYSPVQMMLDISQGSRVASGLYRPVIAPTPALVADRVGSNATSGHFRQWPDLVRRAEQVPGDVVPGLLGCEVRRVGMRSVWVSPEGGSTLGAIAAADAAGSIDRIVFAPRRQLAAALLKAQGSAELVVGSLPPGARGLGVVRQLVAADPARLIVLVQAPPEPARTRLMAIGARGVGGDGGLRSATTRRNGLVVATDVAPTILARLGIERPDAMQGRPIEGAGAMTPAQLSEMNARLALVSGRRMPLSGRVILLGGAIVLLLLLLGRLTGRRRELARLTQRLVALAVLWLPAMLLLTAALRPSRATEANLVVAGTFLLALASDRLVRWPRAPIAPALTVVLLHGIDFLFFSAELTGESLLGSNPLYGARFFGVGNELEAVLTVSFVLGVGALLCGRPGVRAGRWFAAAGVLLALFLGAGRLGADVGGVIFAGAAFGAATVYVARIRLTPLRVVAIVALPLLGLAAIAGLDALTGGQSHLTRTVVEAQSFGELVDVADRRFSASLRGAMAGGVWIVVIVAAVALVWGWIRRERLLAPLTLAGEDPALRRPYRAGLAGALVGTVVGALANDSGPAILIIGTVYIAIGVLYLRGRPPAGTTRTLL
jgi:hypothetical protein